MFCINKKMQLNRFKEVKLPMKSEMFNRIVRQFGGIPQVPSGASGLDGKCAVEPVSSMRKVDAYGYGERLFQQDAIEWNDNQTSANQSVKDDSLVLGSDVEDDA